MKNVVLILFLIKSTKTDSTPLQNKFKKQKKIKFNILHMRTVKNLTNDLTEKGYIIVI